MDEVLSNDPLTDETGIQRMRGEAPSLTTLLLHISHQRDVDTKAAQRAASDQLSRTVFRYVGACIPGRC